MLGVKPRRWAVLKVLSTHHTLPWRCRPSEARLLWACEAACRPQGAVEYDVRSQQLQGSDHLAIREFDMSLSNVGFSISIRGAGCSILLAGVHLLRPGRLLVPRVLWCTRRMRASMFLASLFFVTF